MTFRLRDNPDEVDGYADAVAQIAQIPRAHVEKDFWITEVLRGIAAASRETGCTVIFKGGTSLSKAFGLIKRFSEDVDLLVVLPDASKKAKNNVLKKFETHARAATGLEGNIDPGTTTEGVKRTLHLDYPSTHQHTGLRRSVLVEIGTRGGALPYVRRPMQSLIAEYAERAEFDGDFEEIAPISHLVLDPVRTLIEKLVIVHHAATEGDAERQRVTARHFYDIDMLLGSGDVISDLAKQEVDLLVREVEQHSKAAGLPSIGRPADGFAASPAWNLRSDHVRQAYDDVITRLVWPNTEPSSFEACCQRVHEVADLL
ncbi:MAG: nucleotidyl transferase AbiEii/AbiGii toxin family protein [Acidimicrobiaceae bacterium]|nr:nucleotidyl transferase AbiEii/AbiGii toxin family protein [Acidimicrobiaceae bacterium]